MIDKILSDEDEQKRIKSFISKMKGGDFDENDSADNEIENHLCEVMKSIKNPPKDLPTKWWHFEEND